MKNNIHKKTQIANRKGEKWNVELGFFKPSLLINRFIPTEVLYMKFKIILN